MPDPLHSTSTMFKGKIDNKSRTILVLNDVQKGKNISLSVIPYNSFDLINIKIIINSIKIYQGEFLTY